MFSVNIRFLFILIGVLLTTGCSTHSQFHIKNLAKTSIDNVSQIHLDQMNELVRILSVKLYKKNPAELKKSNGLSIEKRLYQISQCPAVSYPELEYRQGTDAILLGFDPLFKGDRIFAMMYGLSSMIRKSYKNKCELFVLDYLDAQDLYNSARNIEIFVWRLKTRKHNNGSLLILTNTVEGDVKNLSYERMFGKMISLQDTMARIISSRSGRIINKVIQTVGVAFLPIGL